MNRWWIADCHFDHFNIIKYCHRPFKDCASMNKTIIHNWNERVKDGDEVYHLGDFCNRGGVEFGKHKYRHWEEQLNGKIIFIKGNHDKQNGLKHALDFARVTFGNMRMTMMHRPPEVEQGYIAAQLGMLDLLTDVYICGHVHELWKSMVIRGIPVVNVGVEQWGYMPVAGNELMSQIAKLEKGKG